MTPPVYLLEEKAWRHNLELISRVAEESGADIILSYKAFALWRVFPLLREYISGCSACSPYEARLCFEEFGARAHTYSAAFERSTFPDVLRWSSHVTFNSLSQLDRFAADARRGGVSVGLRINPRYSEIATEIYNPCAPGSRYGLTADELTKTGLPEGVEGFLCHNHCESTAESLAKTLSILERDFSAWLPHLSWLNLGGGHLMTHKDYDVPLLVSALRSFGQRHPNLRLILEPGSAFGWQTGALFAEVVDLVEHDSIKTAVLNVSFTCHMPDCLEMPYAPTVRGAEHEELTVEQAAARSCEPLYRLAGCSCLSGDVMGFWRFEHALSIGDTIVFEDMLHYTTVKTTMFNGIAHPSIALLRTDGSTELLRTFTYDDYKQRMD